MQELSCDVALYDKCSISHVYEDKQEVLKNIQRGKWYKISLMLPKLQFECGQTAKMHRKICTLKKHMETSGLSMYGRLQLYQMFLYNYCLVI